MSFVSDLKEKLKRHEKIDFVKSIQTNPDYGRALDKLRELTMQRNEAQKVLAKIELDIDACLVLIEMKKEKEEIDK